MQNVRKFVMLQENLKSSSSQDPTSTGKLVALFLMQKTVLKQETFSHRVDFLEDTNRFFRSNEPFFRFSNPANDAKSLLDGNRDYMLGEARSELMKQEYKVESL